MAAQGDVYRVNPMALVMEWPFRVLNGRISPEREDYRLWANLEITKNTRRGRMTVAFPVDQQVFESVGQYYDIRAYIPCFSWSDAIAIRAAMLKTCREAARHYGTERPKMLPIVRPPESFHRSRPHRGVKERLVHIPAPGQVRTNTQRNSCRPRKMARLDNPKLCSRRRGQAETNDEERPGAPPFPDVAC